jgi:HK97 family phage major capsid protein
MTLQEIRERRAAKTAEARAIINKAESEKRSLTTDETAKFDTLKAEITGLETQEARQQFLDDAERRQAGTVISGNGEHGLGELETRVSLLRVLQAGVEGRSLDGAEAEYNAEMERRIGR